MNATEAREALERAVSSVNDALANYVIEGSSLGDGSARSFKVSSGLGKEIHTDVVKAAQRMTDREFLRYDPSYQTSPSQILVEELTNIPPLQTLDSAIRKGDVGSPNDGADVVSMAHKIATGPEQLVAYRLKGAGIATRRSRRTGLLLPGTGGVYEPVTGAVLYYEPRFDVVTCSGYAFFTTVTLIQSKLETPSKSEQLARTTFARATAKIKVEGIADLERAVVTDPTMRNKMAQLARLLDAEPAYADNLTTKNLVEFVRANADYEISLGVVDGRPALKFDSAPQHRHKIPKLLADDYLVSELTSRKYEAGSKHRVI